VRFPFTFMGLMALGIGLWVGFYLAGHPGLDAFSKGVAVVTGVISVAFGAYVLIRRVRRGPQH
jgi:putative Mn2+ efflux pump MntP